MDFEKALSDLNQAARAFAAMRGDRFVAAAAAVVSALRSGGKVLLFGNGGSAAEAQHFAAELVNTFSVKRRAIPAVALTTDTSCLTSIANDDSFDRIFSRQIEALGRAGDVAIGLSTSGNSPNVREGVLAAKALGLATIALTGEGGGKLAGLPDFLLDVPSRATPVIQEIHLLLLHQLAGAVDQAFSGQ